VVLSDLAPPQSVASGQIRNDLFALGQIIISSCCIIIRGPGRLRRRRLAGTGPRGQRWRNLCNRLLNPNPEKRPRKLAWVYNRVARIATGEKFAAAAAAGDAPLARCGSRGIYAEGSDRWMGKCASTTAGSGDDQSSRASDTEPKRMAVVQPTVDQTQGCGHDAAGRDAGGGCSILVGVSGDL